MNQCDHPKQRFFGRNVRGSIYRCLECGAFKYPDAPWGDPVPWWSIPMETTQKDWNAHQAWLSLPSLKPITNSFERINSALTAICGSPGMAQLWLNTPNPDLDGARPTELIESGKAEIVAELLEDGLMGHPG